MEHLIMECVKIRRLLFLLLVVAIIFFALLAFASSAEFVQGPSAKTINLGPDGSIIHSATLGGSFASGLSPLPLNVHNPFLRTVNFYPDGAVVNEKGAVGIVTPVTGGLQGPSTRTVNVGPDGNVIDSLAVGGVVSDDGSVIAPSLHASYGQAVNQVLVAPSPYAPYGQAVNQVLVRTVVPSGISGVNSVVYTPSFYSGYLPIPYGKSIVAGPSGTIIA